MATKKTGRGASGNEETSPRVARDASSHMRSKATNAKSKSVGGTALSEVVPGRDTSPKQATKASQKLSDPNTGARGKRIAGSVLNQKQAAKKSR